MPRVDDVARVTVPIDTAIYAAGDLMSLAVEVPLVSVENFPSHITSLGVLDYDDQGGALWAIFFDSNPGVLGVVNAAMAISDAQAERILGVVPVAAADYYDLGNQQWAQPQFNPIKVRARDGTTSIWMALQARAASTYASGQMLFKVGVVKVE